MAWNQIVAHMFWQGQGVESMMTHQRHHNPNKASPCNNNARREATYFLCCNMGLQLQTLHQFDASDALEHWYGIRNFWFR